VTERPKDAAEGSDPPPDDESEERPTVIPKFDRDELVKQSRRTTPLGVPEIPREAYPDSGKKSGVPVSAPPETSQMPESMRANLLSMANARVPSLQPDTGIVSDLDRAWEELVLDEPIGDEPPTKPSQSSTPPEDTPPPSSLFGRRVRGSSSPTPVPPGDEPITREHAVIEERAPTSSIRPGDVPREEPESDNDDARPLNDSGDRTIFSPARAAAALTSAAAVAAGATSGARTPSVLPPPAKAASGAPPSIEDTVREMRDRYSLGDYTGALVLAEGLLEDVPSNAEVKDCAENCRSVLRQMYTARIGPLDRVPVVTVARDQLRWLSIDHRAGFVLSHIDGVSSLEMILDVSGMPLLDALRILCELAQQRIISFR
jgi:hypothetical protein